MNDRPDDLLTDPMLLHGRKKATLLLAPATRGDLVLDFSALLALRF